VYVLGILDAFAFLGVDDVGVRGDGAAGCKLSSRVSSADNFARMLAMTVLSFVAALAMLSSAEEMAS